PSGAAAARVPWGRGAEHVVVVAGDMVALVPASGATVQPDVNLALEPRDTLTWSGARVTAAAPAGRLAPPTAPPAHPDANWALEPRDTLTWSGARVTAAAPAGRLSAGALRQFGALVRSAQMAGGLEYLLAQTVRDASERKQLGAPT